jgi:DNA-binding CsgD family transcriptional regulator
VQNQLVAIWHGLVYAGKLRKIMDRHQISLYEVKIYRTFLGTPDKWFTNQEVASLIGVAARTVRAHTRRLTSIGVLEQAELFPAYRYRLSTEAGQIDMGYMNRLNRAIDIVG